ncbi:MAG TPA: DUF2155 domain-containing protein [Caulobacteraceae bacterium]
MTRRARRAVVAGVVAAIAASAIALAQPPGGNQSASSPDQSNAKDQAPPGVPIIQAPPMVESQPVPNPGDSNSVRTPVRSAAASNAAPAPVAPPPAPAAPLHSSGAIIQALDKVTAETMRFAVPVGQKIRYKNLVFQVKSCETAGLGAASPEAQAYVVIDSAPLGDEGVAPPPPRQVFHGWMYANSPGLDPFQHPIYDAWLIACMASPPPHA